MRQPRDVALVLLAAGTSERFGDADKLLADLAGKPLLRHGIDLLAGFAFGERIAVVRDGTGSAAMLAGAGYTLVVNPAPRHGIGGSVALGVAAIERMPACLICLADMPLLSAGHITALLGANGDIVASSIDGIRQPPALFDAVHFPALADARGEQGARALLRSASAVIAPALVLADVDTPDDLHRIGMAIGNGAAGAGVLHDRA